MKETTTHNTKRKSRSGGIAIALLLITFALSVGIASYLKLSMNNARLTYQVIDHQRARIFAESALDAANDQSRQIIAERARGLSSESLQYDLNDIEKPVFKGSYSNYVIDVFSVDASGDFISTNVNGKLIEILDMTNTTGVININTGIKSAFREVVRVTREPFLRYAIFYDGLLELHPGPAMTVNGDVRCNSGIELWAFSALNLKGTLQGTSTLDIFCAGKADNYSNEDERTKAAKKIKVYVDGDPRPFFQGNSVLDTRSSNWTSRSKTVWEDWVEVGEKVSPLKPPIENHENLHSLIEPLTPTDSQSLRKEKLAGKANIYIRVDENGDITVGDEPILPEEIAQPEVKDFDTGVYTIDNEGWIKVHDAYYDPRESESAYISGINNSTPQQMQMVDIYLDKLLASYPNRPIIYIEVEDLPAGSPKPAVRLRNGRDLSGGGNARGLTIATHRTLYVEGDFNNASGMPVLIAADNLTILSNAWDDQNADDFSDQMKPDKKASSTSLDAALMIGYADPENLRGKKGSTYTGGAHNLVRYRENWGGIDYHSTGSYMSLWHATDSHCVTKAGTTYNPPKRHITYDTRFRTKQPPGMPIGYSKPEVLYWEEIDWETAKQSGNQL